MLDHLSNIFLSAEDKLSSAGLSSFSESVFAFFGFESFRFLSFRFLESSLVVDLQIDGTVDITDGVLDAPSEPKHKKNQIFSLIV